MPKVERKKARQWLGSTVLKDQNNILIYFFILKIFFIFHLLKLFTGFYRSHKTVGFPPGSVLRDHTMGLKGLYGVFGSKPSWPSVKQLFYLLCYGSSLCVFIWDALFVYSHLFFLSSLRKSHDN